MVVVALVVACAAEVAPTPTVAKPVSTPIPPASPVSGAAVKEAVQTGASAKAPFVVEPGKMAPPPSNGKNYSDEEWAKIVEAAKKEGTVMHYGNIGDDYDPKLKEVFKKTYGIDVEIVVGTTNVLAERIKNEYRGNVYQVDTIWGQGSIQVRQLQDLLAPIDIHPEFRDAGDLTKWYTNPLVNPVVHQSHAYPRCGAFTINTDVVPPDKYPKKFADLLDPWWKGKIMLGEPMTSITPDTHLWGWYAGLGYSQSFLDTAYKLYNKSNGYVVIGEERNLVLGEAGLLPSMRGTTGASPQFYAERQGVKNLKVLQFADEPIPCSSTIMMGMSVFQKAPHPNAARVWSNWWISKEGQTTWTQARPVTSIRKDVPNPVKEQYWPKPETNKYWDIDIDWMFFMDSVFSKQKTAFRLVKEGMAEADFKKAFTDASTEYFKSPLPPPRKMYSTEDFYSGKRPQ
jgi:iron(III) transport system substrate-binding protein